MPSPPFKDGGERVREPSGLKQADGGQVYSFKDHCSCSVKNTLEGGKSSRSKLG